MKLAANACEHGLAGAKRATPSTGMKNGPAIKADPFRSFCDVAASEDGFAPA
jgi:hypothetical protein